MFLPPTTTILHFILLLFPTITQTLLHASLVCLCVSVHSHNLVYEFSVCVFLVADGLALKIPSSSVERATVRLTSTAEMS